MTSVSSPINIKDFTVVAIDASFMKQNPEQGSQQKQRLLLLFRPYLSQDFQVFQFGSFVMINFAFPQCKMMGW